MEGWEGRYVEGWGGRYVEGWGGRHGKGECGKWGESWGYATVETESAKSCFHLNIINFFEVC